VLLVVLAAGFPCYAVWRLAQAIFDRGQMGTGIGGLGRRTIQLVQGATYCALTASAIATLAGKHPRTDGARHATAGVLGWPGGRELVAAPGITGG